MPSSRENSTSPAREAKEASEDPPTPKGSPPPKEPSPKRSKRSPIRAPTPSPERERSRSATPKRNRDDDTERDRETDKRSRSDRDDDRDRRRKRSESPRRRRQSRSPRRDDRGDRDRRRRSRSAEHRSGRRGSRDRDQDYKRRIEDRLTRRRSRSRCACGIPDGCDYRERDENSSPSKKSRRVEEPEAKKEPEEPKQKKEVVDILRSKAGGAYIPPAKLKMMQEAISDKNSEQYQRMNWERLKKKIHGLVNKVNVGNLVQIVRELLQENVIRGQGVLVRSVMQAQAFSPVFSHVYAALIAIINSKFPNVGELMLRRLIVQFKRCFRRNDKATTVTVSKFIAHLINQQVAHEILALEIMILMLETPTDDSVEVAIAFLKECGAKLLESSGRALNDIYERLRAILNEASSSDTQLDKRIQYMIEVAIKLRGDKFKAYPAVIDDLDLIDEEDQTTHIITLEEGGTNPQNELNVFKMDPDFEKNEAEYEEIRQSIIGDAEDSDDEEEEDDGNEGEQDDESAGAAPATTSATTEIIDNTEQALVAFRREVYLTIQSSLEFQEAAHKLLKMRVKKELEGELCHMLVDCCAQQRTYEKFYGQLCERFCRLKKEFQMTFEQVARDTYATIHRFEITKLRNMAKLISHLLFTDAISWNVLSDIRLTEEDTTSSGRIYIKYVFQELCEYMGLTKLYERIRDPTMASAFAGLFPRDNPANSRFAINFFTLIGLGGLTIDLREFLEKGMKKPAFKMDSDEDEDSTSSDSSDSSDSDSSDSDSDSSSSSSDSSDDDRKKKKKKKVVEKKKKEEEKSKKSKEKEKENKHARRKEESPVKKDKESHRHRHRERTPEKKIKEEPKSPEASPKRKDRRDNREKERRRGDSPRRDRGERDDRRREERVRRRS